MTHITFIYQHWQDPDSVDGYEEAQGSSIKRGTSVVDSKEVRPIDNVSVAKDTKMSLDSNITYIIQDDRL